MNFLTPEKNKPISWRFNLSQHLTHYGSIKIDTKQSYLSIFEYKAKSHASLQNFMPIRTGS